MTARVARVTGTGMLALSVWLAPATSHFEANSNGDANVINWVVNARILPIDSVITGSLTLATGSSAVFGGTNLAEKTARARPLVTAMEIAEGFRAARLSYAQLRDAPDAPEASATFAQLETGDTAATGDQFVTGTDRVELAALARPAAVSAGVDALEAISEVAASARDPSQPYPVPVPQQLAYAREVAPETIFKPTLRQPMRASKRERWCLSQAVYFEARGESYRGQIAVAQVVRNRVEHAAYPNTICGVVFQNQKKRNACQFSFACDGVPERVNERSAWAQAQEISDKVIAGELYLPEVSDATHYHANYVRPPWAKRMTRVTRIGAHIFYRFKRS